MADTKCGGVELVRNKCFLYRTPDGTLLPFLRKRGKLVSRKECLCADEQESPTTTTPPPATTAPPPATTTPNYLDLVLKIRDLQTKTGVPIALCIQRNTKGDVLPKYDVFGDGNSWEMAFRGMAGVGTSVYDTYITPQTGCIEYTCLDLNNLTCPDHYRNNEILDNWSSQNITEVAFVIYDGGAVVKWMKFDAAGTTYLNWYSKGKLTNNSWDDLAITHTNYFSVAGHANDDRRFFVNSNYFGCPNDHGWFCAVDRSTRLVCSWEKRWVSSSPIPQFIYSADSNKVNWQRGNVAAADFIAIFTR